MLSAMTGSNSTVKKSLFPHRHLLGIEGLQQEEIISLLDSAAEAIEVSRQVEKKSQYYGGALKLTCFLSHLPVHNLHLS